MKPDTSASPTPQTPPASGFPVRLAIIAAISLIIGVSLGAVILLSRPTTPGASNAPARTGVGAPAPDFTLTQLDGKTVKLSDLRGKKVLLNFWATWCVPCKTEMPDLMAAQKRLEGKNAVILGVGGAEKTEAIRKYIDENHITYPIPVDETGTVSDAYRITSLPTSIFIDSTGTIQLIKLGQVTQDQVVDQFDKMS
jgi:peroxiredoxin